MVLTIVWGVIYCVLRYEADKGTLQVGAHLCTLNMENVRFTDVKRASVPTANADEPLIIRMKNVTAEFHESAVDKELFIIDENAHTTVIVE